MSPRRAVAPEDRRKALLDAAVTVLLDKGSAALTVDEVTTRAGVAKGTFYLYFRSKEQVLAALRERFVHDVVTWQLAELGELPDDDWIGRLERWMESSIRGYLEQAALHDALFLHPPADRTPDSSAHTHAAVADPDANAHARTLVELLEAGTAAGAFDLTSPRAAGVLLYAAMHGAADYLIGQHADTPAASAELVEDVIAESRRLCHRLVISR